MVDDPEEVRLTLRLPASLRDKIAALSKESGRSLNAEIVSMLERSIGVESEYGPLDQVIGEIWQAIEKLQQDIYPLAATYHGRDPYNDDD
ncbi:Arc family DNA-binding protein [Brucella intermedia]|uniref:Arc family DNA-binding protein n=1 Tax=Brucella intermedia TaxID=94625 RepID=UPI00165D2297|nr:Arc family DNA-binding protein [Brucella intermedia]QNQ40602.1 Arc family DNA-binding protein [Brucella intermedia]